MRHRDRHRGTCRFVRIIALVLSMLGAPTVRADGPDLQPFSVLFDDGAVIGGWVHFTTAGRAVVTDAWLLPAPPDDGGGSGPGLEWIPIVLEAEGGMYAIRGGRVTEQTVVLAGLILEPVPPGWDPVPGPFAAFLSATATGDGYGSSTAVWVEEAVSMIPDSGEPPTGEQQPACTEPGPGGESVLVLTLSENELLVIILYPDGSLEMVIYARDRNGCWYLRTLPMTMGEDDDVIVAHMPPQPVTPHDPPSP